MLKSAFGAFGEVLDATVMRHRDSGISRGFGFVTFSTAEPANKVCSDGVTVDNRSVDCKHATAKTSQGGPSAPPRGDKIFVGGLASHTTEEEFRAYFEPFGTVTDVTIMKDRENGRSRGFGFVTFRESETVDKLLASPNHSIGGKLIECKRAVPRDNRSGGGGGGGGGGHWGGPPMGGRPPMGGYGGYPPMGYGGYGGYPPPPYGGYGYNPGYGYGYGHQAYGGYGGYDAQGQNGGQAPADPSAQPSGAGYDAKDAPATGAYGAYGGAPAYGAQGSYDQAAGAAAYGAAAGYGQTAPGYDQSAQGAYGGYGSYGADPNAYARGPARGAATRPDRAYHPYQRAAK